MIRSLHAARLSRHGNAPEPDATPTLPTPLGLDVDDAVYHLAHDFPGGVPALAQRMGMSHNTLAHKVSLTQRTHHLSPRELVKLQAIAGDARVLHAIAHELGFVALPVMAEHGRTTLQDASRLVREFSELLTSVSEATDDGRVTLNEMRTVEHQAGDVMVALNACLSTMRSMMPEAPEGLA